MKRAKLGPWLAIVFGMLYFVIPLIGTFEFSLRVRRGEYSFDAYRTVLTDPRFQSSFLYSTVLALATIVVGILLVVPTAYWIQLRLPKLRPIVEFITLMPLVIPAIVLVFGYLRIYNSSSLLPLTGSEWSTNLLLTCSYVTLALPYMYRAVDTGLRAIDRAQFDRGRRESGRRMAHDSIQGDLSQCPRGGIERRLPDLRHRHRRVHDGEFAGPTGLWALFAADGRQSRL
jgi:ABC-type spermidine/putrescine transport system permease subunit II